MKLTYQESLDLAKFKSRLIRALTEMDRKQSKKKDFNPYALAQYFMAAESVFDAKSFADAFTPCRFMHKVAKLVGLNLDVKNGKWVNGDV